MKIEMKTFVLLSLSLAVALGLPRFPPGVAQYPVLVKEEQSSVVGDWVPAQGHMEVENPAPQARLSSKEVQQQKMAPVDMKQSQSLVELQVKVKPEVQMEEKAKAEPEVQEEKAEAEPEVQEEKAEAEPEVQKEKAEAEPKVQEEKAKAEPEVQEEKAEAEPEVQKEKAKAEPEVQEEKAEAEPEVQKEKAKAEPEVQKEKAKAEPEVQEEKAEAEPEVQKEKAEAEPKVQEEKAKAEPEVQKEKAKAEPEVQEEKAKAEPEVQEEKAKAEPEVQKEKAKAEPEVQEEKAEAEPEVQEDSVVMLELEAKAEPEAQMEEIVETEPENAAEVDVQVDPEVNMKPEGEMESELKADPDFQVESEVDVQMEPEQVEEVMLNKDQEFQVQMNLDGETDPDLAMEEKYNNMERRYEMVGKPIMELEPLDDDDMIEEDVSNAELSEVEKSMRAAFQNKDPVAEPLPEEEEELMRRRDYVVHEEPIVELEPERLDTMGQPMSLYENNFPNEEARMMMSPEKQEDGSDYFMREGAGKEFIREEEFPVQMSEESAMEDNPVLDAGAETGVSKREARDLFTEDVINFVEVKYLAQQEGQRFCPGVVLQGKCYQFFRGPKRAADAEFFCQEHFPRGHLASITSQHVHRELMNLMLKQNGAYTRSWVGGLRYLETGRFIWLDGSHWEYADWLSGEPNNTADVEDCLEVLSFGNGKFNDFTCWEPQAFFCSYPYQ